MKWILFATVCILLCIFLKGINSYFATCLALAGAICLSLVGLSEIKELYLYLLQCNASLGQAGSFFPLLLKILGITYLCEFGAVLSKEVGFLTLSLQIETLGKLAVMLAGMPLVFSVMDQIKALLG